MQNPEPPNSARNNPSLRALCIVLWLMSLLVALIGILLLGALGEAGLGGLLLLLAGALGAAGLGLYRLRRWGAALFGVLALLGSVNFLTGTLNRANALTSSDPAAALWALTNILVAIMIPLGLIYVTLALWRQLK
jgi:hypothetical protein